MLAEEVAGGLPGARLAAVTRAGSGGPIYGVVYRQTLIDEDSVRIKAWLLRLSEAEQGNFYWDDFVPVCKSCENMPLPYEGEQPCPVCQGQKGPGKCFQFCFRSSALRYGCGELPASRPTYCGSHPFFGGYRLPDAVVGDAGPALWEEKIDSFDRFAISMAAAPRHLGVMVLPGYSAEDERARGIVMSEDGPAIISPYKRWKLNSTYVSATVLAEYPHLFLLMQRYSGEMSIWKRERRLSTAGASQTSSPFETAEVDCPAECTRFGKQVVRLGQGLVALSKSSLWAMDLSTERGGVLELDLPQSATPADLATKVSWRKVMDLPLESEVTEEKAEDEDPDDFDPEALPTRLLAVGPRRDQVMIFKTEGLLLQPWLLVEMRGDPWGAETHVTKVTSTASVPWKRKEELYEPALSGLNSEYCSLLPSVLRMSQRHGGYLFFDERGRSYRLRDEEILLQQDAWVAPSFDANASQRIVTFNFPSESGAGHSCLFSVLARFEYFQKALENWQEGASAQVVVKDASTETFDLLLRYFHTGTLDSMLTLENLVGLLELGNKYLLPHLMTLCMSKILRLLGERGFISDPNAALMADLLIVAGEASAGGSFKVKIMDAIASSRPDLTHDAAFLARVSARSVDLLAQLLSSLRSELRSCESVPKRRKIQCARQKTLWSNRQVLAEPAWSSTGLIEEGPRLL